MVVFHITRTIYNTLCYFMTKFNKIKEITLFSSAWSQRIVFESAEKQNLMYLLKVWTIFNFESTEEYVSLAERGVKQSQVRLNLKELPLSHQITKEKKRDAETSLTLLLEKNILLEFA